MKKRSRSDDTDQKKIYIDTLQLFHKPNRVHLFLIESEQQTTKESNNMDQ